MLVKYELSQKCLFVFDWDSLSITLNERQIFFPGQNGRPHEDLLGLDAVHGPHRGSPNGFTFTGRIEAEDSGKK